MHGWKHFGNNINKKENARIHRYWQVDEGTLSRFAFWRHNTGLRHARQYHTNNQLRGIVAIARSFRTICCSTIRVLQLVGKFYVCLEVLRQLTSHFPHQQSPSQRGLQILFKRFLAAYAALTQFPVKRSKKKNVTLTGSLEAVANARCRNSLLSTT